MGKKVSQDLIDYLRLADPEAAKLLEDLNAVSEQMAKTKEGMKKGLRIGKYSPEAVRFIGHRLRGLSTALRQLSMDLEAMADKEQEEA